MASKKKAALAQTVTPEPRRADWAWTPELLERAKALALSRCTHKHPEAYPTCMGCFIRAKAEVRWLTGGPSSAELKAARAEKAAKRAPAQAVAFVAPVSAEGRKAQIEAQIAALVAGHKALGVEA